MYLGFIGGCECAGIEVLLGCAEREIGALGCREGVEGRRGM